MEHAGTVESMLWTHRHCLEGDGDTAECCGRRAFLLELCRRNGWNFPSLGAQAEPESSLIRVRQRHGSTGIRRSD